MHMFRLQTIKNYLFGHVQALDASVSLFGFSLGLCILFFLVLFSKLRALFWFSVVSSITLFFGGVLLCCSKKSARVGHNVCPLFENCWRAFILGLLFGSGLLLFSISGEVDGFEASWPFGIYMCFCALFHWSEFYFTAIFNLVNCSVDTYMLTHSFEYLIALVMSLIEYWLGHRLYSYLFPFYSLDLTYVRWIGFIMCVSGEVIRKLAIYTAKTNFNHYVLYTRQKDHQLVKFGVYSWFRHPAYVGWFYWSIGTQILLLNPLCTVGYMFAAFFFFKNRIYYEEMALVRFFGEEYRRYQASVWTGLPLIYGYQNNFT